MTSKKFSDVDKIENVYLNNKYFINIIFQTIV